MPNIADVARRADVSVATVSRVLNHHPRVDPQLAARVRKAVRELGYEPTRAARTLRTRKSRVWSLIISDIRNAFFTDVARGMEDVAYEAGYSLILCNAGEDPIKESAYIRLALAEQVAGIIVAPARITGLDLRNARANGVPVVAVDRRSRDANIDCVLVDNVRGASAAVGHLVDNGYQRIACITGPLDTTTGSERLRGYQEALAGRDDLGDHVLTRHTDYTEAGGYTEMMSLLDGPERPDAVFIANNSMALGALRAIDARGLAIPRDIAVVCFDDPSWAQLLRPALTAVAQPTYDLGLETARLLLSRLEGYEGAAREVILSPDLRIRQSSAPKAQS